MDPYQLFTARSRVLVGLLATLVSSSSPAKTKPEQLEASSLLRSVPGPTVKVFRDSTYLWAEYCPDNTCDVIRTSAKLDVDTFRSLASAYYFYFSSYEYTKQWQSDADRGKVIEEKLRALDRRGACAGLAGKELARCGLSGLERKNGLQILFIRYDEGSRSQLRIPTKEALQ